MLLNIVSFNGHTLNDSSYSAWFPYGQPTMPNASPTWLKRAQTFAKLAGKEIEGVALTFRVECKGATFHTQFETLKEWFAIDNFTPKVFVVADDADSDRQWYCMAYAIAPVTPAEEGAGEYIIQLAVDEPLWRTVTPVSDAWNITASDQTHNITVIGNEFARPILKVKPTSTRAGGFGYARYIPICNRTTRIYTDAINLIDGNWDTTPLTPTKMQADGDDCRVFDDISGQEVFRWFGGGGIDTTTTRVFVNAALPPMISLTLSGTLSSAGAITEINVQSTAANVAALKELAAQSYKVLVIDMGAGAQEVFTYTGIDVNGLKITGVTPAAKFSTRQNHADAAVIRHVSAGYWILYGNSALSAPSTDNAFQPMIDTANSTNVSHVYTDYNDPLNPARIGQWIPQVMDNTGGESEHYTATQYTFAAGAASVMGMACVTYLVGVTPRAPTCSLGWVIAHPAGITTVTASGKKRRQGPTFPAIAGLRVLQMVAVVTTVKVKKKLNTSISYVQALVSIWNEASPSAEDTWESLAAHSAVSLGATYLSIGLYLAGAIGANDEYAAVEYDSITVALDSNYTPLIWFGAENVNNHADFRITNTTTAEWLEVHTLCAVNDTVVVDVDELECYLLSDPSRGIPITLDDESRMEWLRFTPGVNTLKYTESGVAAVTLTSVYEPRSYL